MEKKIVVSCSFREFDGSENAKIQWLFLESIKNQTHKNVVLAVTNFREKTVEKAMEESGLNYVFFQSPNLKNFYSISEVCSNAASLLTPGDSILLHSSADHIFPPHFFKTVVDRLPKMGSVTSFPQKVYDGTSALKRDQAIEDGNTELRLHRGMLGDIDDSDLPGIFAMDPNHWLPDTVAVDGDLFLQDDVQERLVHPKYIQLNNSPGVAQNTMLAFLAKPGKRVNIVLEARYIELLNDYLADPRAVPGATTFAETRRNQDWVIQDNWNRLEAYAEDVGMEPYEYKNGPLIKLNQVALYDVVGTAEQRIAFSLYLELWRMRYLAKNREIEYGPEYEASIDLLKKTISSLYNTKTYASAECLNQYTNIWLYGASSFAELASSKLSNGGLTIAGIADTFQTGKWNNFDILSPAQLIESVSDTDAVIIASSYHKEIYEDLREKGISAAVYTVKENIMYPEEGKTADDEVLMVKALS